MGVFVPAKIILPIAAAAFIAAAVIALAVTLLRRRRLRITPATLVWATAALYAAAFSTVTLARHFGMATYGLDLGYYGNVIYQFGHGRPFVQTLLPMDGYFNHCAPLLVILAPFTYVFRDAAYLLPLQSFILAAGIPLIYYLARPAQGTRWPAALLAVSFALMPALHGANLYDFHPRAFAVPLALGAFLFYGRGNFRAGLIFTVLLALAEDELALHAVGLAFYGGVLCNKRKAGLLAAAAVAAYFFVFAVWLYPRLTYAHAGGEVHYEGYFAITKVIEDPEAAWRVMAPLKGGYIGMLLLPALAFIPTGGWAWLTLITPLAVPTASTVVTMFQLGWQYPLSVLPFVYGSAALGARRLVAADMGKARVWFVAAASMAVVVLPIAFAVAFYKPYYREVLPDAFPGPYENALHGALKKIPPSAVVCADEHFCAHLAHRPYLYSYYQSLGVPVPRERDALILERRFHSLMEFPAIQDWTGRWGLYLTEYTADYAYFTKTPPGKPIRKLFFAWFRNIEEWQCSEGTGRGDVVDPLALDGRADLAEHYVYHDWSPDYIYPPGKYRLAFRVRPAARGVCPAAFVVTLADPDNPEDTAVYRLDADLCNTERYKYYRMPISSEKPFMFSFLITAGQPFYFDTCVVNGGNFRPATVRKMSEEGYSPLARKERDMRREMRLKGEAPPKRK